MNKCPYQGTWHIPVDWRPFIVLNINWVSAVVGKKIRFDASNDKTKIIIEKNVSSAA